MNNNLQETPLNNLSNIIATHLDDITASEQLKHKIIQAAYMQTTPSKKRFQWIPSLVGALSFALIIIVSLTFSPQNNEPTPRTATIEPVFQSITASGNNTQEESINTENALSGSLQILRDDTIKYNSIFVENSVLPFVSYNNAIYKMINIENIDPIHLDSEIGIIQAESTEAVPSELNTSNNLPVGTKLFAFKNYDDTYVASKLNSQILIYQKYTEDSQIQVCKIPSKAEVNKIYINSVGEITDKIKIDQILNDIEKNAIPSVSNNENEDYMIIFYTNGLEYQLNISENHIIGNGSFLVENLDNIIQ